MSLLGDLLIDVEDQGQDKLDKRILAFIDIRDAVDIDGYLLDIKAGYRLPAADIIQPVINAGKHVIKLCKIESVLTCRLNDDPGRCGLSMRFPGAVNKFGHDIENGK